MNREIITKKDYQILEIKENSTPEEINSAYEKLILQYHPEKIKLEKLREPIETEIKKYKEIDNSFKKFDLAIAKAKYLCCGVKENVGRCMNEFYPALWIKVEEGQKKYFCSQECYNSKWKSDELVEKWKNEDAEWRKKKLNETKKSLVDWKRSHIRDIENELKHAKISKDDLEPENRNYEQEINSVTIKDEEDQEWISKISDITRRVSKDIWSKSKRDLRTCDCCKKSFKGRREGNAYVSYGATGKDGDYIFCSEECREKGMKGKWFTVEKKNVFVGLLKWMEKEVITNISLDPKSGKLVVEYGKNNSKIIEDDNLTAEQREIKNLLQQIGKNSLSQNDVREEAKGKEKGSDNKWVGPAVGIGIVALVIILIGIVIYKHKKKG